MLPALDVEMSNTDDLTNGGLVFVAFERVKLPLSLIMPFVAPVIPLEEVSDIKNWLIVLLLLLGIVKPGVVNVLSSAYELASLAFVVNHVVACCRKLPFVVVDGYPLSMTLLDDTICGGRGGVSVW